MTEYVQASLPGFEPPTGASTTGRRRGLRALLRGGTRHVELDFPSLVVGCLGGVLLALLLGVFLFFLWRWV